MEVSQREQITYQCPDCHSLVPRGEEYTYYCNKCEEYLAIDNYSVNHFVAKGKNNFKMLADTYYIPSLGNEQLTPIVREKLLKNSTLKQLTIGIGPEDDISRVEWFRSLLKAQKMLSNMELIWQCSTDPVFVNTFSIGLGSCVSLTNLVLRQLKIHKGAGELLGEAIKSLTNLTSLEFNNLVVDVPEEMEHLSSSLKSSKSIQKFIIHDDITSWNIINGVFEENKSIETLILTSVKLSTTLDENTLKKIFNGLKINRRLLNLEIECSFDRSAVEIVADGLRSNSSITNLTLVCDIDNNGLDIICDMLNTNKTIKSLNLPRNKFTSTPSAILSSSLTELNMHDGNFLENDFKQFGEALKTNTTLKSLSLRGNLSGAGCKSVMDALKVNNTLETLDISLCNCYEEDLNDCIAILETHPSLVHLTLAELGENDRKYSAFGTVVNIIKNNTNLESLFAFGPYDERFNEILDSLKLNDTLTSVRVAVTDGRCMLLDDEEPLIPIFEVNHALRDLFIYEECPTEKFLKRNIARQQKIKQDTAVILHNIARNPVTKSKLPIEIWIHVFKWLRYPGLKSFADMAQKIFGTYK
jgi:hypothetical protein